MRRPVDVKAHFRFLLSVSLFPFSQAASVAILPSALVGLNPFSLPQAAFTSLHHGPSGTTATLRLVRLAVREERGVAKTSRLSPRGESSLAMPSRTECR